MTSPGRRRIDRILAEDFLADLSRRSLPDVRAMRAEAEQEEADLSYARRLVQGRIDIVRAELARRGGDGREGSLVEALPHILADEGRSAAHGLGRHSTVEPSRLGEHRRRVEALVADAGLSDVTARSEEELRQALRVLVDEEVSVSAQRRQVQAAMDACTAEVGRRYRDGTADVEALLPRDAG